MNHPKHVSLALLTLCLCVAPAAPGSAADQPRIQQAAVHAPQSILNPSEAEKIEQLILTVENLEGAVFIRNGSEHTPRQAARHMRTKLRRARRHVESATDFIEICATRSSMTGRVYLIRWEDGTTVETAEFLTNRLREIERGA